MLQGCASLLERCTTGPAWPGWPCSYDETSDAIFYEQPRFVTHIDDGAINALTQ